MLEKLSSTMGLVSSEATTAANRMMIGEVGVGEELTEGRLDFKSESRPAYELLDPAVRATSPAASPVQSAVCRPCSSQGRA